MHNIYIYIYLYNYIYIYMYTHIYIYICAYFRVDLQGRLQVKQCQHIFCVYRCGPIQHQESVPTLLSQEPKETTRRPEGHARSGSAGVTTFCLRGHPHHLSAHHVPVAVSPRLPTGASSCVVLRLFLLFIGGGGRKRRFFWSPTYMKMETLGFLGYIPAKKGHGLHSPLSVHL